MNEMIVQAAFKFWNVLIEMAPYLLFGFFMAGLLSIFISPELVERHLGGKTFWSTFKAALFGVPLPLCSCGVIPVAASLRRHGASRGATTAFLLSTPQTGVDSILVTFSLLGPVFAVFRPLAALIGGILGGTLINAFEHESSNMADSEPKHCKESCCSSGKKSNRIKRVFSYGFITLPRDIARSLVIGLILAGIISAVIPDNYFMGIFGTGILSMIVMMLCGIPLYVCATASVPIAVALMAKGISPGAAWVFLTTGPATNAATIATIWQLLGRRSALLYLLSVIIMSFGGGILLNYLFASTGMSLSHGGHEMLPEPIKIACALVLIGILIYALKPVPKKN
ncbi:MAG: permease [Candidatus Auribacter fodinae]|jgi:uncharacterized membrane protein YraQ (UPF0718 family)|uniref:Permease n=1 Tax=Candidatus Auribacter fodinae TaxID=2093366 RepID=A0A3A4R6H6_9BACT|nr:MAG: permease [Candidatus Auribacter fodinae]